MTLMDDKQPLTRFLTLQQVSDELNVSRSQTLALVRDRVLIGVKIGGRGQWRVERDQLEAYITRLYEQADTDLAELTADDTQDDTDDQAASAG